MSFGDMKYKKVFLKILKEHSSMMSYTDLSSVDVEWCSYEKLLSTDKSPLPNKKTVKLYVLMLPMGVENFDEWFRSHDLTYSIFYKTNISLREDSIIQMVRGRASVKEIASKLNSIFEYYAEGHVIKDCVIQYENIPNQLYGKLVGVIETCRNVDGNFDLFEVAQVAQELKSFTNSDLDYISKLPHPDECESEPMKLD